MRCPCMVPGARRQGFSYNRLGKARSLLWHTGQLTQFQALGGSLLEASAEPTTQPPLQPSASFGRHTLSVMTCALYYVVCFR